MGRGAKTSDPRGLLYGSDAGLRPRGQSTLYDPLTREDYDGVLSDIEGPEWESALRRVLGAPKALASDLGLDLDAPLKLFVESLAERLPGGHFYKEHLAVLNGIVRGVLEGPLGQACDPLDDERLAPQLAEAALNRMLEHEMVAQQLSFRQIGEMLIDEPTETTRHLFKSLHFTTDATPWMGEGMGAALLRHSDLPQRWRRLTEEFELAEPRTPFLMEGEEDSFIHLKRAGRAGGAACGAATRGEAEHGSWHRHPRRHCPDCEEQFLDTSMRTLIINDRSSSGPDALATGSGLALGASRAFTTGSPLVEGSDDEIRDWKGTPKQIKAVLPGVEKAFSDAAATALLNGLWWAQAEGKEGDRSVKDGGRAIWGAFVGDLNKVMAESGSLRIPWHKDAALQEVLAEWIRTAAPEGREKLREKGDQALRQAIANPRPFN